MHVGGRIAETESSQLTPWEPESSLEPRELNEIRFSRGFLRAQAAGWFPQIANHWVPFFHSLGAEVEVLGFSTGLNFPENLSRIVPIEIDAEAAVIGLDELSQKALVDAIAADSSETGSDVAIEYVERRLLSSLMMTWAGPAPLHCHYVAPNEGSSVEVVGAVHVRLNISGMPCSLWLGLGARVMDRLDLSWRNSLYSQYEQQGLADDEFHSIGIDIAELAVPPALLIDYMRSGTIIDLEIPLSNQVYLTLDGQPWATGELLQYNGRFAVSVTNLNTEAATAVDNTTRVQIQIAECELDHEGIIEHSQPGAILLSKTAIGSTATMVISGESVASAVVGQIDGQFALNVLPK